MECSDVIYTTPINFSQKSTVKCRMPTPVSYHGLEIVNGCELLIIGGTTNGRLSGVIATVLLYNTVTNTLRELHPLPFPMCDMATVKHDEDVIIIGGQKRDDEYLSTVFKYNCKQNECEE